ncbi:MAG: hypothetical protein QW279_14410 [Candidatus Jordarchaeaceae archaeon]
MLVILSSAFILGLMFFAQGTNNPLLLNIIQLCGQLGYIDLFAPFREWGRLCVLVPLFLVIMLLSGLFSLKGRKNSVLSFLLLSLVTTNIVFSPSLVYINNVYSPTYMPPEYNTLKDQILMDHKVLWIYPSSAENILGAWRYVWDEKKAISENLERSIGSTHNPNFECVKMLTKNEAPQQLLNALNIKYIIKRTDVLGASNFGASYQYLNWTKLTYLTICENPNNLSLFYVPKSLLLSDIDGKNFYSITFPPIQNYVAIATEPKNEVIKAAQIAISNFESSWLYERVKECGIILAPFKVTYNVNPGNFWSKASTADLLHTDWHPYIEKFGMENFQSDYGEGLVFTWAVSRLKDNLKCNNDDLIKYWFFNSITDLNQWKNYTSENQFGTTYTITLDNYSLKAELWNSTFGWKTINSPLITVTPETPYQFDFYIAGENSHNVHAKIFEYDVNKTFLTDKIVADVGSGNFTWKNVKFQYVPSKNATYVQLQIWHGHETTQFLPNKIWIDNVKIYDLKRYQPSDLDVIWVYSTQDENETLKDILKQEDKAAEVIKYQRINPAKYVVKVNATKPFMLSFAESYDPLWVACVNKEKIQSVSLYGVINGFWINQTGLLEITVEYEPQEWFYIGSIISVITICACATCLFCDWVKKLTVLKKQATK